MRSGRCVILTVVVDNITSCQVQGTEDFMAIEVRAQEFGFTRRNTDKVSSHSKANARRKMARNIDVAAPVRPPQHLVGNNYTWFYNPIHDMESIFWLMLYFIVNKDVFLGRPIHRRNTFDFPPETEEQLRRRVLEHWNFGLTLFSGRTGRDWVMLVDTALANTLIKNPLHPAITPLAATVVKIRDALTESYRKVEVNPPLIDHQSGAEVHAVFKECIDEALNHLQRVPFDVQIRSLRGAVEKLPKSSSTHASTGSKRLWSGEEEVEPKAKSQRVSMEQKSPSHAASPDSQPQKAAPTKAVPLPTRVLRSHARKAAAEVKASPPSPHPVPRSRKAAVPTSLKVKATKDHEAVKAATRIAATKAKTKTRKGR